MLYPNNIKKEYHHNIAHANRGMDLEKLINEANLYYLNNDIGIIYKKPTPITISKVEYSDNEKKLTKGLFQQKSTLDYVGIYKGKYLDFDAKCTLNKSAFPLSNIHPHQLEHIKRIIKHGGISFLIIEFNNEYYLFKGETLIDFIRNNERKSIPLNYIEQNSKKIKLSLNPTLDYLKVVDEIYIKEGND